MHFPASASHRRLPLLALLALTLPYLALSQPSSPDPADEFITLSPAPLTLDRVRALYGEPSQRIGADLWVYWNFTTTNREAQRAGYDTLIVHTSGNVARTIKLVRGTDVRGLLRQLGQSKRAAAAASPRPHRAAFHPMPHELHPRGTSPEPT